MDTYHKETKPSGPGTRMEKKRRQPHPKQQKKRSENPTKMRHPAQRGSTPTMKNTRQGGLGGRQ